MGHLLYSVIVSFPVGFHQYMQSISEVAQDESDKHTLQDVAGHRVFWILVALVFAENHILDLGRQYKYRFEFPFECVLVYR